MHPSLESNMLYQLKDVIHNFITQVANLRVAVIGETIKDEFIPVIYEGQSMKSFCPVLKKTEDHILVQEGGAKAIANHIKDFVKEVHVYSNPIDEIVKSRYIDSNDQKKYIEINRFNLNNEPISVQCSNYDVVIVADFGHGFCDRLSIDDGFHLMCQTNSNNFGFNRVSKWKKHKKISVCIDLREASLQLNKKIKAPTDEQIFELFHYELNTESLFITLGSQGSVYCANNTIQRTKSFKSKIVDTIGAGDAFFAFSSLLSHTTLPDNTKLIIPSLAASLTTTWLCNEQSVSKEKLLQYADQHLQTSI